MHVVPDKRAKASADPGPIVPDACVDPSWRHGVRGIIDRRRRRDAYKRRRICYSSAAPSSFNAAREIAMAKGQMRSNKEKKKPKADKNMKKGGATPSPFSSGKTPAGQSPHIKK
jgi:hypothetical protein